MTALTANDIVVVPIRSGVGLRLGANIGYLKFTPQPDLEPVLIGRLPGATSDCDSATAPGFAGRCFWRRGRSRFRLTLGEHGAASPSAWHGERGRRGGFKE